jgi:UDP-glucose:(heptosyl)LPS alpha-1,3-glucosyltransferase
MPNVFCDVVATGITVKMRIALVISSFFPSGGLQRECVAIARSLAAAGHAVTIVTADHRSPVDTDGVLVETWSVHGLTNPRRDFRLGRRIACERDRFDLIVGFNKMPNLDVYFCGDPPYAEIVRSPLARLSPKFFAQLSIERQVFAASGPSRIIMLSPDQANGYRRHWSIASDRLRLIAPTLDPARRHPEYRTTVREQIRNKLGMPGGALIWLAIASVPRTKGIDRTLTALTRFTEAVVVVAGLDANSRNGAPVMRRAERLGVASRIRLLSYREDVAELMAAADLLVHPARLDTTGMVILEAIVNGLPAVVTSICGFAVHVRAANAGIVVAEPFVQAEFERAISRALEPSRRQKWSANGAAYGQKPWLTSGHSQAVELILGALPRGARTLPRDPQGTG